MKKIRIDFISRTDGRDDDLVGNQKAAGGGFVKVFGLNIFEALAFAAKAKYFIQNPQGLTFTNPVGWHAYFAIEVIIPVLLDFHLFLVRLFKTGGKRWLAVAMAYKR